MMRLQAFIGLCSVAKEILRSFKQSLHCQGSNLTFELNSHMASTCSGFTSHKRVSSSLGTSVQHKILKKCQKSCGYQMLIKTAT